ncbi:MAG: hypothetical protein IPK95_10150 [Cellvibrionales bacterium]|nr:hypothetical protein [Cellvibrionales bacterium]
MDARFFLILFSFTFALLSTEGMAAPGDLDPTFGNTGVVLTSIGISASADSVVVQSDGKLVAAGYSNDGAGSYFTLVRYNGDGALDTDFGNAGKVITNIGVGSSYARAVIQQTDGKLVVAGGG